MTAPPPYWPPPPGNPPGGRSAIERWSRTPPGWPLGVLAVAAGAAMLYAASTMGGAFGTGLVALMACLAIAVLWLVRTIVCAVSARRFFLRMLIVPLVFGVTFGLLAVDAPVRLRFELAQSAFEQAVREIEAGKPPEDVHGRLGTYPVERAVRRGPNIYFVVDGAGFLGGGGIAYLPAGPPDPPDRFGESDSVTPMDGPWYRFSYSL